MLTYHFNFTFCWNLYESFISQRKPKTTNLTILTISIEIIIVSTTLKIDTKSTTHYNAENKNRSRTTILYIFLSFYPHAQHSFCLCHDNPRNLGETSPLNLFYMWFCSFQPLTQNINVFITTIPWIRRDSLLYHCIWNEHTYYEAKLYFQYFCRDQKITSKIECTSISAKHVLSRLYNSYFTLHTCYKPLFCFFVFSLRQQTHVWIIWMKCYKTI